LPCEDTASPRYPLHRYGRTAELPYWNGIGCQYLRDRFLFILLDSRVNPNFINLGGIVAEVFDVTEDMTLSVLTQGISEQGSDCQVDGCRLLYRPTIDRQSLDENEALAMYNSRADVAQELVDTSRQGECILCQ
jgi:hypothetical protein